MLTAKEVAAQLKLSLSATYLLFRQLPHVQLGRSLRVTPEALEAYILSHTCAARNPVSTSEAVSTGPGSPRPAFAPCGMAYWQQRAADRRLVPSGRR